MHPLRHPRNAAFVGIIFIVIGVDLLGRRRTSAAAHLDYAGVTMLAVLGIAMGLMAYVLVAGSPND